MTASYAHQSSSLTAGLFALTALLILAPGLRVAGAERLTPSAPPPVQTNRPIPWAELGAKAATEYSGDGLAVSAAQDGTARLRCAFQKLEGEVTREGLWLTSTADGATGARFRVVADNVGRDGGAMVALPGEGMVGVDQGRARYARRGLVEEYSVSADGVRQDFVVAEAPSGVGDLRVELALSGARAEPGAQGAQLVLDGSRRKLAYSRLRAVDASGRELTARIEVVGDRKLALVVADATAVYPVRIDPTFSDANWVGFRGFGGANDFVRTAVVDGAGNLYVGGYFTAIGMVAAKHIAKWDGTAWSALGSGMNDTVYGLAVSGADLYAGGLFTTAGGVSASRIAKWNGSRWSALGSGVDDLVICIAIAGPDLYAGGFFATAGGVSVNRIAKWDGSVWSALGSGMDGGVFGLAVSGTGLYAGGKFSTADGVSVNHIAKWDGSTWSPLGLGMDGGVFALAVSGTNLYAGGDFITAGGMAANRIARWNGSAWSAVGSGMNNGVSALVVSGTDLYAGGDFTMAGGVMASRVAKWNGASWSALGSGMNQYVVSVAVSGTNLYAGGYFTYAGGKVSTYVAKAELPTLEPTPVVTTSTGALTYARGDGPVRIDIGLWVTDEDSAELVGAAVSITGGFQSAEDVLGFADQNGIAGSYSAGTGVLTLNGEASVVDYLVALRSVTYRNTSANPKTAPRVITFEVNDGKFTGKNTRMITPVEIQSFSNESVITINDLNNATPYPSTIAVNGASGTVRKVEVLLRGITHTYPSDIDILLVGPVGQKTILMSDAGGSYGVRGVDLAFDDSATNGLTAGLPIVRGTYKPTDFETGDTFGTPAPAGPYVASLSGFVGANPNGIWSLYVRDDAGADVGTIAGGWTLTLTLNHPLALTTRSEDLGYRENDGPVRIDNGLTVIDADHASLVGASVSITSGFQSGEDVLTFTNQNGIVGAFNPATGVLALGGTSNVPSYQAALRSVTYQNTSENPSTMTRLVTFTADDGAVTSSGTRSITVTAINDAPQVTTTSVAANYTEHDGPVSIDTGLTVTDPDDASLVGASVGITSGFQSGEDVLAFTSQNGITGAFSSATGVLTLSGLASVPNYQAALRSVTYNNTSDNPGTAARLVTFTADDGTATGGGTRTINVQADAAFCDFNVGPPTDLKFVGSLGGGGFWRARGGADNSGYLALYDALNSQHASVLMPDFANGRELSGFTFDVDLRVGNAVGNGGRGADGFSINFARVTDPVVVDLAQDPPVDNLDHFHLPGAPESGTSTGLAICFDMWSGNTQPDGGPDIEGIMIKVDGSVLDINGARGVPMPTRNGSCADATSMQTGPWDEASNGDPSGLCWAHLKVELAVNGELTVTWKGTVIADRVQTGFAPGAGRVVFAGRTGIANQNVHIDNFRFATIPMSSLVIGPPKGLPAGFTLGVIDSGAAVFDATAPGAVVSVTLDGAPVAVTPSAKVGRVTTLTFNHAAHPFSPASIHAVSLVLKDLRGAEISRNLAFLAPAVGARFYEFDTDPRVDLKIVGTLAGGSWRGAGSPGHGGYLALSDAAGWQYASVLLPDLDNGRVVQGFAFDADLRVGNAVGDSGRPADGFSINFARVNDPVVLDLAQDPPVDDTSKFHLSGAPESGTATGLAICFDTRAGNTQPDGGPDLEGIMIKVDGTVLNLNGARGILMSTRNGSCADATSMQTGPYDEASNGDPAGLCWAHLRIELAGTGELTVTWKGVVIADHIQTRFAPSAGRFVLAARTSDANENTHVDNLRIATLPLETAVIRGPKGLPAGFTIAVSDSGASVFDATATGAIEFVRLDDAPVIVTSAKVGKVTSISMNDPAHPFVPGSTHAVSLSIKDLRGVAISKVLSFLVPVVGTGIYEFETDPSFDLKFVGSLGGGGFWRAAGGADNSGYLALYDAVNSQHASVLMSDFDNGREVRGFTFDVDLRVGNAVGNSGRGADGFSINFARVTDPVVLDLAQEPPVDNLNHFHLPGAPESGTSTGLAICFDMWSGNTQPDGGTDIEGIMIKVDGTVLDVKGARGVPMPTRNGSCTDATSMQTGPWDEASNGDSAGLCWAHLKVDLAVNGELTVTWKGTVIADKVQTGFAPGAGRIVLAGRTSGANQNVHIDNFRITAIALPAAIAGRHVFYNRSFWDGKDYEANVADDGAIATDKSALLPGQKATFANYISYNRGINGIMVDLFRLGGVPTADDFIFKVGTNNTLSTWLSAPVPSSVSVRAGAGVSGSDRITLVWPDFKITNEWLQVTTKATTNTGLAADDVFYFGHATGETGDSASNCNVLVNDALRVLNHMATGVAVTSQFDIDRSGGVLVNDAIIVLNAMMTGAAALQLIDLGGGAGAASVRISELHYTDREGLAAALEKLGEGEARTATARKEGRATEPCPRVRLLALEQLSDGATRLLFEWPGSRPVRVWRSVDLNEARWEALPEAWVQMPGGELIAVELPPSASQPRGFYRLETTY